MTDMPYHSIYDPRRLYRLSPDEGPPTDDEIPYRRPKMDRLKFLRERLMEIRKQCEEVSRDEGYMPVVRGKAASAASDITQAINTLFPDDPYPGETI